jgi:predicted glutamine amidotransferase
MCGLAGFAKTPNEQSRHQMRKVRKISKSLLKSIADRGKHSTGVSVISEKDEPIIYKTLQSSDVFVDSPEYNKISNEYRKDTSICMLHTRHATEGDVTVRNAHPFVVGSTIGAHNGMIYNHEDIDEKHKELYEVDSQYLFHFINDNESLQKALDEIYGDYALSWIKNSKTELNLLHEGGRDLAVAYWKKAKVLFYASTKEHLKKALSTYGVKAYIYDVTIDTHYVYDVYKFSSESTNAKTSKIESNTLEYNYTPFKSYYGYNAYDYYGQSDFDSSEFVDYSKRVICMHCNKMTEHIDLIKYGEEYSCLDCEVDRSRLENKVKDVGLDCCICGDYADIARREGDYYYCENCYEDVKINTQLKIEGGSHGSAYKEWI